MRSTLLAALVSAGCALSSTAARPVRLDLNGIPARYAEPARRAMHGWQRQGCPVSEGPGDVTVVLTRTDPEEHLAQLLTATRGTEIVWRRIEIVEDIDPAYDIESIMAHEIGHALGLDHSTRGLMAPIIEPGTHLRPEHVCKGG